MKLLVENVKLCEVEELLVWQFDNFWLCNYKEVDGIFINTNIIKVNELDISICFGYNDINLLGELIYCIFNDSTGDIIYKESYDSLIGSVKRLYGEDSTVYDNFNCDVWVEVLDKKV